MKYTKGNWIPEERQTNLEVTIYSNNKRICEVKSYSYEGSNDPTTEEADANAKLIAAAPDLLIAALKIKEEIDTEGLLQGSWEQMLVAIKKATE